MPDVIVWHHMTLPSHPRACQAANSTAAPIFRNLLTTSTAGKALVNGSAVLSVHMTLTNVLLNLLALHMTVRTAFPNLLYITCSPCVQSLCLQAATHRWGWAADGVATLA